jgi:hypothetical protein
MIKTKIQKMSAAQFEAYRPHNEDDHRAYVSEADYRTWCKEEGEDFEDDESRDKYRMAIHGEEIDDNDRAGGDDNLNNL